MLALHASGYDSEIDNQIRRETFCLHVGLKCIVQKPDCSGRVVLTVG